MVVHVADDGGQRITQPTCGGRREYRFAYLSPYRTSEITLQITEAEAVEYVCAHSDRSLIEYHRLLVPLLAGLITTAYSFAECSVLGSEEVIEVHELPARSV